MKNPSMLFALIALSAGIMASGFIGIDSINRETLARPLAHELQEQSERVLPSLAHTDSSITVVAGIGCATTIASGLDRNPSLVSRRPAITRCVTMCFGMHNSNAAVLALSRSAAPEVTHSTDRFSSAVTTAIPELRSRETQSSPLTKSLPGQINDSILISTVATHGRLALGEVRAEQLLLDAAIASAKPVLSDDVRNDRVLSKSFASQINEPFRACHLMSPSEEYLSGTHERYPAA